MSKTLPKRPYLLRAMHQWITECGNTPHVIVDAGRDSTEVPRAYVKDGKIVLNLSESATERLRLGNHEVEFDARFAGVIHHVRFPLSAVLGIYARETGEGMVFSEQEFGTAEQSLGPEPPTTPPTAEKGGARRPQLKVVK
jgi:stringent starvation protein B